jgi:hypothetical protein
VTTSLINNASDNPGQNYLKQLLYRIIAENDGKGQNGRKEIVYEHRHATPLRVLQQKDEAISKSDTEYRLGLLRASVW